MSKKDLTIADAEKVLKVVDKGLCTGLGDAAPGHMCVEAAVCYALGGEEMFQEHEDRPPCVKDDVIEFKITVNDNGPFKDNKERAKALRRISIAQLGSVQIKKSFVSALEKVMVKRRKQFLDRFAKIDIDGLKEEIVETLFSGSYLSDICVESYVTGPNKKAFNGFESNCSAIEHYVESYEELGGFLGISNLRAVTLLIEDAIGVLRELKSPGIAWMDKLAPLSKKEKAFLDKYALE